jgi:hypothetical protein
MRLSQEQTYGGRQAGARHRQTQSDPVNFSISFSFSLNFLNTRLTQIQWQWQPEEGQTDVQTGRETDRRAGSSLHPAVAEALAVWLFREAIRQEKVGIVRGRKAGRAATHWAAERNHSLDSIQQEELERPSLPGWAASGSGCPWRAEIKESWRDKGGRKEKRIPLLFMSKTMYHQLKANINLQKTCFKCVRFFVSCNETFLGKQLRRFIPV